MKAIQPEKNEVFVCVHWKTWPPTPAIMGLTAEKARMRGIIDDAEYARMQTWERVCGLMEMDTDKCLTCPHVRKLTQDHKERYLTTLDGKLSTPMLTTSGFEVGLYREGLTAAARLAGSPGSGKNAAWVENSRDSKKDS